MVINKISPERLKDRLDGKGDDESIREFDLSCKNSKYKDNGS